MAAKKTTKPEEKLSTREVAEAIGTSPKTLRVFLRASSDYSNAGPGSRYAFEKGDLGAMKTRFDAWTKQKAEEKARREAEEAKEQEPTPEPVEDEKDEKPKAATRRAPARKAS